MQKQIIVIIGGPGSGKTSVIDWLTNSGYCCYPEISREVTLKAKAEGIDQLFLTNPVLFSQMLLEGRIKQFIDAQSEHHEIVFIDRGIPDVLAYMNFIGDHYPETFKKACVEHQYSKIFVLPPWEDIYISDNERYENYEQAQEIHKHLVKTYESFGYNLIEVPRDTVENRATFLLNNVNK